MRGLSKQRWKNLSLFLVVALLVGLVSGAALADEPEDIEVRLNINRTDYTVNGVEKELDVAPFIENGRTFVPIRFVAEEFGMEADWGPEDGLTEWVHFEKEGLKIEMTIGDPDILVIENGDERTVTADVAPHIRDGRTFLPLRAIGEVLGAEFDWGPRDAFTQWVSFTLKAEPPAEFDVLFQAVDEDDEPLDTVMIEMNDMVRVTDEDGTALFEDVPAGFYEYTANLFGYLPLWGDVTVVDEDKEVKLVMTEAEIFQVAFQVEDAEDEEPLEGAEVELDEMIELTDEDGRAVFEEVYAGEYMFTVDLEGYETASGDIDVDEDLEIWVSMEPVEDPDLIDVTLVTVDDAELDVPDPIEGSVIQLYADEAMTEPVGDELITDEDGIAETQLAPGQYWLLITHDAYPDLMDDIEVEADVPGPWFTFSLDAG